jgi:hypothetical protein
MECEMCSYLQWLIHVEAPKLEAFNQDLSVGLLARSSAAHCVPMRAVLAFFLNASTQIYLVILSKWLSCCLIQSCFISPSSILASCVLYHIAAASSLSQPPRSHHRTFHMSTPYPRARPHSKQSIRLVHRTSTQVYTLYLQWKLRGNFVPAN